MSSGGSSSGSKRKKKKIKKKKEGKNKRKTRRKEKQEETRKHKGKTKEKNTERNTQRTVFGFVPLSVVFVVPFVCFVSRYQFQEGLRRLPKSQARRVGLRRAAFFSFFSLLGKVFRGILVARNFGPPTRSGTHPFGTKFFWVRGPTTSFPPLRIRHPTPLLSLPTSPSPPPLPIFSFGPSDTPHHSPDPLKFGLRKLA